jgi:hypothetical protein
VLCCVVVRIGCNSQGDWSCDFKLEQSLYRAGFKSRAALFFGLKVRSYAPMSHTQMHPCHTHIHKCTEPVHHVVSLTDQCNSTCTYSVCFGRCHRTPRAAPTTISTTSTSSRRRLLGLGSSADCAHDKARSSRRGTGTVRWEVN